MKTAATGKRSALLDHGSRVHPESQGGFWRGVMHAVHGVRHVLLHERNARVHLMFAVLAFLLASACLSIGRRPIGQRYYRRNVYSRSPEHESMPTFGVSSLHHQSKG